MELSVTGFRFICGREGYITKSMKDNDGNLAVGLGCHYAASSYTKDLSIVKDKKFVGAEFTVAEVAQILTAFFEGFDKSVNNLIGGANITQNQFDALYSIAWNYGEYAKVAKEVAQKLKNGESPQTISQYIASLTSNHDRRVLESEYFLKNDATGSWRQINFNKFEPGKRYTTDEEWKELCDGNWNPGSGGNSQGGAIAGYAQQEPPNAPRPIMASRGANTVYRLAKFTPNTGHLGVSNKRREGFEEMAETFSNKAPELGRDIIIFSCAFSSEILKNQDAKTFKG